MASIVVVSRFDLKQEVPHGVRCEFSNDKILAEIGERRYVIPNLTSNFFTLTEASKDDHNPELLESIKSVFPEVQELMNQPTPLIISNRNSLRKLLTLVSFDSRNPKDLFYVNQSFEFHVERQGRCLIFNRKDFEASSGIGVDFETKATTHSESYHQVISVILGEFRLILKYEVDGIDEIPEKKVELKTVKRKPRSKGKTFRKISDYKSSLVYSLEQEKYRSYWIQMVITNINRLILASVVEVSNQKVVVEYEDYRLSEVRDKAWSQNSSKSIEAQTKLKMLLKWIYESAGEERVEYIVSYNAETYSLCLKKKLAEKSEGKEIESLTAKLSTVKIGK